MHFQWHKITTRGNSWPTAPVFLPSTPYLSMDFGVRTWMWKSYKKNPTTWKVSNTSEMLYFLFFLESVIKKPSEKHTH